MVFKIILLAILILYGCITLFAYMINDKIEKDRIKTFIYTVIGVSLIISALGLFINANFIILLVLALIGLHLISIYNGYIMYKKPNWKHHGIRLIISIVLIYSYFCIA